MCLVFNERSTTEPGLHALIVGVSAYPHLLGGRGTPAPDAYGMEQLQNAASTAAGVADWLIRNSAHLAVPLATCRLLLAPAPDEPLPASANGAGRPTLAAFLKAAEAWRRDAATRRENMTVFYFAGHGAQRSRDEAIAMLEDFGDGSGGGALKNAVSTRRIFDGMVPDGVAYEEIARTQLYFVDACRAEPHEFKRFSSLEPTPVFDVVNASRDDRCAPIYMATLPGELAFEADEGTLFGQAVLRCLDGGAGELAEDEFGDPVWQITARSLERALAMTLASLADAEAAEQESVPGGMLGAFGRVLVRLPRTPLVDVTVELLPTDACTTAIVEIVDEAELAAALPTPLHPHPHRVVREAGMYKFRARHGVDGAPRESPRLRLDPPSYHKKISMP